MLDTKRHDELFDKNSFTLPVHIIGAGGVGSHVARHLAKLGVGTANPVSAYDADVVESRNLPNQSFDEGDVGVAKVTALQRSYRRWSNGLELHPHVSFVTKKIPLAGVVFLCVDRMDQRKLVMDSSIWDNEEVKWVIETRTNATYAMVHSFDPANSRHRVCWEAYYYPNSAADNDLGCNGPVSIITSVEATAVFAVQSLVDFVAGGNNGVGLVNRFWINLRSRKAEDEYW